MRVVACHDPNEVQMVGMVSVPCEKKVRIRRTPAVDMSSFSIHHLLTDWISTRAPSMGAAGAMRAARRCVELAAVVQLRGGSPVTRVGTISRAGHFTRADKVRVYDDIEIMLITNRPVDHMHNVGLIMPTVGVYVLLHFRTEPHNRDVHSKGLRLTTTNHVRIF